MHSIDAGARTLPGGLTAGRRGRALARQEFARAFGIWFVVGVLVTLVGMLMTETGSLSHMFTLQGNSSHLPYEGMEKSALFLISPVVVTLPYAASYVSDHRSRYLRYLLPRCGWRGFARWRFIANAVAGAMCVFTAQALLMAFSCIAYPYVDVPYRYISTMNWFQWLEYRSPMLYILLLMVMQLPCHMARASTALAITPWVRNPFVPLITPLLWDNALAMLSRNLPALFALRDLSMLPIELVSWGQNVADVYGYFICAALRIALCYAVFYIGVKRNAYK